MNSRPVTSKSAFVASSKSWLRWAAWNGAESIGQGYRPDRGQFSLEPMESRLLLSVTIQFDTSLDTSGFFTAHPDALGVLQAAANDLTSRLANDHLTAIPAPSGTNTFTPQVED